jgi:hypothetical protein
VSENGAGSVSVTVYCPKVVTSEKTRLFERAVAESSSSEKVAGVSPPVAVNSKTPGLSGSTSLATVILPGKTTASAEIERSCFPVLQRPGLHVNATSAMWYGEPGIVTADLSLPQSRRSEM